jgi:N-acetylmuramoyl-L-alanine amidase
MKIVEALLPYWQRLQERDPQLINLVVIHCTELPDMKMAREFGERIIYSESGTGVSGHYYIDRDGSIFRYVPEDRIANHVIGHNEHSIGIELVNSGRYPKWFYSTSQYPNDPYTAEQIDSLKELLKDLRERNPTLKNIAGHSDLDITMIPAEDDPKIMIRRKIDPGPQFPWDEILNYWVRL